MHLLPEKSQCGWQLLCYAVDALRRARWITRERVMYCGLVWAVISAGFLVADVIFHTTEGLAAGEPLAFDFGKYFAAARAAAGGEGALVYDNEWFQSLQNAMMGFNQNYTYPPVMILLTLPLGLFSFFVPALIVWTLFGAGLGFVLLQRLVEWRAAALAVLGTPAAFFNIYFGQNGYFTAALLAGGLMMIERHPVLAGMCFGCLASKPHLGILLPFALAAGGQWRSFAAAAAMVGALVLASLALFGTATWTGFHMSVEGQLMDLDPGVVLSRMPTVFCAARELGIAPALAYSAQIISGAVALVAITIIWRHPGPVEIKAAALTVATFLATPYAWDYDTVVLIFAAAWLAREGVRTGFLPWERISIVALLVFPLLTIMVARGAGVPLGPAILWLVLLALVRRVAGNPVALRDRSSLALAAQPPINA